MFAALKMTLTGEVCKIRSISPVGAFSSRLSNFSCGRLSCSARLYKKPYIII